MSLKILFSLHKTITPYFNDSKIARPNPSKSELKLKNQN